MGFSEAFNLFKSNGSFKLDDTQLTLTEIEQITDYLTKQCSTKYHHRPYQFCLTNVSLLCPDLNLDDDSTPIITGAVSSQEIGHSILRVANPDVSLWHLFSSPYQQINSYLSISSKPYSHKTYSPIDAKQHIENKLSALWQSACWQMIELNNITVDSGQRLSQPLSNRRLPDLPSLLKKCPKKLETLSLKIEKTTQATLPPAVLSLLKQTPALKNLYLESNVIASPFLDKLREELANHAPIQKLSLGKIQGNDSSYDSLSQLLDEHYCNMTLSIQNPAANATPKTQQEYNALMKRLSLPSETRFQTEQLNADKLMELAWHLLTSDKPELVRTLLKSESEEDPVTLQPLDAIFPVVYKRHKQFSIKGTLDLQQRLRSGQSVGYALLEKASSTENATAITLLLKARANIFENPSKNTNLSLLVTVLNSQTLRPVMQRYLLGQSVSFVLDDPIVNLQPFAKVNSVLKKIKALLDTSLNTLLLVNQCQYLLLRNPKKIEWEKKITIWGQVFRIWQQGTSQLLQAIPAGTAEWAVTINTKDSLRELFEELIESADQAQQAFSGYAIPYQELQRLGKVGIDTVNALPTMPDELQALRMENNQLHAQIEQLKEKHEQDRQASEAARRQDQAASEAKRQQDRKDFERKIAALAQHMQDLISPTQPTIVATAESPSAVPLPQTTASSCLFSSQLTSTSSQSGNHPPCTIQ